MPDRPDEVNAKKRPRSRVRRAEGVSLRNPVPQAGKTQLSLEL
jgi:hypothetical protein